MQFPLNTSNNFDATMAGAPGVVRERVADLQKEDFEAAAERTINWDRIHELDEQISGLATRLNLSRQQERDHGRYRQDRTVTDPTTDESKIVSTPTGYVEGLQRNLDALQAKRRRLAEKKSRRSGYYDQVVADLSLPIPPQLIPAEPINWTPAEGEQLADGYKREYAALKVDIAEEDSAWNAPRPRDEATSTALAEIDRIARAPEFGGHRRGHQITHRGRQIATDPRIAWPMVRVGEHGEAADGVGVLAWLFKDQLKAAVKKEIAAKYTDEGAISAEAKAALVVELANKVWHQRRVVEAAYRVCRTAGIRNLNRPIQTPTEILLDVLPWKKRGVIVQPMTEESTPPVERSETSFDFEDAE